MISSKIQENYNFGLALLDNNCTHQNYNTKIMMHHACDSKICGKNVFNERMFYHII